ncbi:hypothetical protein AB6N24_13070 [Cellulomonas sp. 179-A 4D5 NHS]|uniref:hypothetical protein n=1 Tax=Cellulomonas sp. 179-A 4D5 NHS TaxID=3142378 RepID=UPI0039A00D59
MIMSVRHAVLAGLASAALVLAGAVPAAAVVERPTFLCSTLLAEQSTWYVTGRVEGDLVVDASCAIGSATVTGDVLFEGAHFLGIYSSTVEGDVRPSEGRDVGQVEAYGSVFGGDLTLGPVARVGGATVGGDLVLRATPDIPYEHATFWEAYVDDAVVDGSVRGSTRTLTLERVEVAGSYDVTASGITRLRRTTVDGDVAARGDSRVVVHDAVVGGSFTADRTQDLLLCRGEVGGDLTVRGVRVWSRVGEEGTLLCRSRVGGSLHVVDNPSTVVVGSVRVAGGLLCSGNTGSRVVVQRPVLVVEGTRSGQCA